MEFDVQQEAKIKADLDRINKRERNEINKEKGISLEDLDVREDLDVTQNYNTQPQKAENLNRSSYVTQSHDGTLPGRQHLKRRDPNAAYVPEAYQPEPAQQQPMSNRSALNMPPPV